MRGNVILRSGWVAAAILAACSSFDDAAPVPGEADGGPDATTAPDAGSADDSPIPIDTTSDPKNCGSVGHDCLGGACTAGRCQPFEIYRGTAEAPGGNGSDRVYERSIAVDATRVVWLLGPADGNKLGACAKTGCAAGEPLLVNLNGTAGSIAADDEAAYVAVLYTGSAGIYRFAPTGTTKITGQITYGADIRVAGDRIYIGDRRLNAENGGVHSLLRDGGSLARIATKPLDLDIVRLDVSTDALFVASFDRIYARALDGGELDPPAEIVDVPQGCFGLVVDRAKGVLYWSDRNGSTIHSCGAADAGAGCSTGSTEIAQGKLEGGKANALSFDGSRIYVVSDHEGTESRVASCDPSQCAATWTVHARAALVVGPPAIDAAAIYWMERPAADAGAKTYRVMKAAK